MYQLIRKIHLILGLVITPFLFIYAISAIFFSHSFLDASSTETNVKKYTLTEIVKDPSELPDLLAKKYGIRGEIRSISIVDPAAIELVIVRPVKTYKVLVDTNTGKVKSEEITPGTFGFIKALHYTAGFQSDDLGERWWGFAVMIVGVLLIFILITGFILWIYQTKERLIGIIFLLVSTAYGVCILCVLRFS